MTEITGEAKQKKVHIETWGCQMNVADSERMLAMLNKENYELADSAEDADLVLLNTCHIREKARHKVVSRMGKLRKIKESNPGMKIAVTGCVAQAEGSKLLKAAPGIDILVGPGKIDELTNLIKKNEESGSTTMAVGFKKDGNQTAKADAIFEAKPTPSLGNKTEVTRFVNIQQGCNNYCTFCVVPYTRGREISREPEAIIAEAQKLLDQGATEITLLGQNVNSYGLDLVEKEILPATATGPFVDLLAAVSDMPQLQRLRFTTSNPHDFQKPLSELFGTQEKMGKYIHLPVQSGNDDVLVRMKRKVTVEEFFQRVDWLRTEIPDMAISTDLIVGFPGETEEEFQGTLDLVEKAQFSFIFCFKYSPRNNTVAKRMADQIPEEVKSERLARLNALQDRITLEQNRAEIGKERDVLVLYESRKEPGIFYGRSEHYRLVRIESKNRSITGELAKVEITQANKTALVGKLV
jgi:tRNA-2-methylthio-N6-dimethylallyladenosine synthase